MPPKQHNDAHLLLSEEATPLAQPLQIRNESIQFLTPPLQRACNFTCSADRNHWRLVFFENSESTVVLDVVFSEGLSRQQKRRLLASARWINNDNNNANNTKHAPWLSEFLRGSQTNRLEQAIESAPNRELVLDRAALGYFCFDHDQFERVLICFALAVAYQQAMFTYTEKLAAESLAANGTRLAALYKATLRFNASAYFGYPIKRNSHELFEIWAAISRHWHLGATNTELTQQLSDVATLIRTEENAQVEAQKETERKREEQRDRAFQQRTTWLVVWLTALSLIALSQITPSVLSTFFQQWHLFFTNLSDQIGFLS